MAILTLIPVYMTGSQVEPVQFSRGLLSSVGGGDGITHDALIHIIFVILAVLWKPEMKLVMHAMVDYGDVWVSASDFRLLKSPFRSKII
jgi:hypothetical protein